MATTSYNVPAQITTDAEFRTWGSSLKAALAAVGLVQAADTGQIDWTTVTKPTVGNTAAGYEIWEFNDTLQATAPVFIKIEYGTAASATQPSLWVTVGTSTNGAGALGGQMSTRKQLNQSQSATATVYTSYVSGASNRLSFCLMATSLTAATAMTVNIERSHDATGADTADGISVFTVSTSNSTFEQFIPTPTGSPPSADTAAPALVGTGNTAVVGSDTGLYPHFPFYGKALNPKLGVLSYKVSDIADLAVITVSMYGSNHNYMALGSNASGNGASQKNDSFSRLLMRYE